MDGFIKVAQVVFYVIWIPLGILLIALTIFLLVSNPLGQLSKMMGPPQGNFGNQGGSSGAFPSEEMLKQFMQQGQNQFGNQPQNQGTSGTPSGDKQPPQQ